MNITKSSKDGVIEASQVPPGIPLPCAFVPDWTQATSKFSHVSTWSTGQLQKRCFLAMHFMSEKRGEGCKNPTFGKPCLRRSANRHFRDTFAKSTFFTTPRGCSSILVAHVLIRKCLFIGTRVAP